MLYIWEGNFFPLVAYCVFDIVKRVTVVMGRKKLQE
jgi:hypothetical protein